MRKFIASFIFAAPMIFPTLVIVLFLILDITGIYSDGIGPYIMTIITVIVPGMLSRSVFRRTMLGKVESQMITYLLKEQSRNRRVRKGTLLAIWEKKVGMRTTETIIENLRQSKLIDIKKIREGNRSFSAVSPTWRTRLLAGP